MSLVFNETSTVSDEAETESLASESEDECSSNGDSDRKKKLDKQIKRLSRLMHRESSIFRNNVSLQRNNVRTECENLLEVAEYRLYALNALWLHYWYAPIKTIVGKSNVSDDLRAWLKKFISYGVRHLKSLSEKYDDLQPVLFIFIGDLHRYAFANCGRSNVDFESALKNYTNAIRQNFANGRPFNQMALLWQETGDTWKALGQFLKALITDEPFVRALDNLKRLDEQEFETESRQLVVFAFIRSVLLKFSRTNTEKWKKEFEVFFEILVEAENWKLALESIYYITCTTIYFSKREVFDEHVRYLGAILCQSWATLLKSFIEKPCVNNLMFVLCSVGEFFASVSKSFMTKKIAVSLKFQYQNVAQLYSEILNANIEKFVNVYTQTDIESNFDEIKIDWLLSAPHCNDLEVLVKFLKLSTSNLLIPLSYDGVKFNTMLPELSTALSTLSISIVEEPLKEKEDIVEKEKMEFMEKIGKAHLEFVQKQEAKKVQTAMLPVYLFPDVSVLLDKLTVLQNLATTILSHGHRFIIIIAELVLSCLDGMKRESQRAREAIRWLQSAFMNHTGKIRIEMTPIRDGDVQNAALQYLSKKNLLERKSLFGTVLTAQKMTNVDGDEKCSIVGYTSLSMENVDTFFLRIVDHEDSMGLN